MVSKRLRHAFLPDMGVLGAVDVLYEIALYKLTVDIDIDTDFTENSKIFTTSSRSHTVLCDYITRLGYVAGLAVANHL